MRWALTFVVAMVSVLAVTREAAAEWQTACKDGRCQLFYEIANADSVVQSRIYFHSGAAAAQGNNRNPAAIIGIVTVPLGVYIPAGVNVVLDGRTKVDARLVDCRADEGCRAAFDLDDQTLRALKRGAKMDVTVQDRANERNVTFTFSLMGFTKAYDDFLKKLSG